MSLLPVSLLGRIEALRAAALQSFMEAVAPVTTAPAATESGARTASAGLWPREAAGSTATLQATILAPPRDGKLSIALADGIFEVDLPPELARRAQANPASFLPGQPVQVRLERQAGGLRLALLATGDAQALQGTPRSAATLVSLSSTAAALPAGPSVAAAPPLPLHFPPGSLGAAVTRLAGLALPVGERAGLPTSASLTPRAVGQENAAARTLLRGFPVEIADAARHAARLHLPLGPALTRLIGEVRARTIASAERPGPAGGGDGFPALQPSPTPAQPQPALARLSAFHQALAGLSQLRLDGTARPDPGELAAALRRSGLFLEAGLARAPLANGSPPAPDLKAALLRLGAILPSLLAEPASERAPAPAGREPMAPSAPQEPARSAAQPSTADLPRLVEGAVERIKLMQLASLPDRPELTITDDRSQTMRLSLALPIATRGPEHPETATIGLLIEHQRQPESVDPAPDDAQAEGEGGEEGFPWLVLIAVDLEETGPVQAEIALRGQRVAVTLWAERKETAGRCREDIGELHAALDAAAFEVSRLEVKDGRPLARAEPARTPFDRRT